MSGIGVEGLGFGSVIPERGFRVDRMTISERELVEIIPELKPYSYIFYTDAGSVADFKERWLPSKLWRMNNLYKVKTKSVSGGGEDLVVDFIMKRQQLILYASLVKHPRVVVLKSRQIGISTVTVLMFGDDMMTIPNLRVGIVAQAQDPADELLAKISFALKGLDKEIRDYFDVRWVIDNNSSFGLVNGSKVSARLSFRSGTLQRFAWTEVGKIAAEDPKRITETLAGSMQAIEPTKDNWIVKESTAEGDNYFKDDFFSAVSKVGSVISNKESRPLFFSWLDDPTCNSSAEVDIDKLPDYARKVVTKVIGEIEKDYSKYIQTEAYRKQIGSINYPRDFQYRLSQTQKAWLVGALDELQYDLELFYREYPHTPESAFYINTDRMWYKTALSAMVDVGRVVETESVKRYSKLWSPDYEVFAVADIGLSDLFFILYVQVVDTGRVTDDGLDIWDIRVLGEDVGSDAKTDVYAEMMWNQPYIIDELHLPHDGGRGTVMKDSVSVADDFIDMGFRVNVLNRPTKVLPQILVTRRRLYHTRIDKARCPRLWESLNNYKKKFNKQTNMFVAEPVHDEYSHGADAFRYVCNLPYTCSKKSFKSQNVINEDSLLDYDTPTSLGDISI